MAPLIDRIAPMHDVSSRHTIWIAAPPQRVYQVARTAKLGKPWPVQLLLALRILPGLPELVLRPLTRKLRARSDLEHEVGAVPFLLVDETPGEEFVLGIMGRLWTPTGGLVRTSPERLRHQPPPDLAQAFWSFRVTASGTGTELSTETRVRCGDDGARRKFRRYWRLIRPGSSMIRRSILRHIRKVAETERALTQRAR
jgi:hypothetical protein